MDAEVNQAINHLDRLLEEECLPPYPHVHSSVSICSFEEIRRTILVANISTSVTGEQLIEFFESAGPVKYLRFCCRLKDPVRYCLIEFSALSAIVNALKLNGQHVCGRAIKVYHSMESIKKPSYLNDPEEFHRYLLELKSRVEEAHKCIEKASKEVSEYDEYCTETTQALRAPLKSTEMAIAEIEDALSKVLCAQSLLSVIIHPVKSLLLNIFGEESEDKNDLASSPESLLKYVNKKTNDVKGDSDVKQSKTVSPEPSKVDSRTFHDKRHSRDRKDSSVCHGKSSHHHREHKSGSNECRTGGQHRRKRHSEVHDTIETKEKKSCVPDIGDLCVVPFKSDERVVGIKEDRESHAASRTEKMFECGSEEGETRCCIVKSVDQHATIDKDELASEAGECSKKGKQSTSSREKHYHCGSVHFHFPTL